MLESNTLVHTQTNMTTLPPLEVCPLLPWHHILPVPRHYPSPLIMDPIEEFGEPSKPFVLTGQTLCPYRRLAKPSADETFALSTSADQTDAGKHKLLTRHVWNLQYMCAVTWPSNLSSYLWKWVLHLINSPSIVCFFKQGTGCLPNYFWGLRENRSMVFSKCLKLLCDIGTESSRTLCF